MTIHSLAAFTALGYVFLHVVSHYLMGGVWQLLRVIRPMPLQRRWQQRLRATI